MTSVAVEASWSKMSTLPAERRRVAISVMTKKEICWRKAENPKATQSELSQFASDRFGLSIGTQHF